RVTMDGIAIAHADLDGGDRRFTIAGTQAAGAARLTRRNAGECIEVMTGAMLPAGCDTVVPVERLTRRGADVEIAPSAEIVAGQFVHRQGSDRPAGSVLLVHGMRVGAPEMAVLASAGR